MLVISAPTDTRLPGKGRSDIPSHYSYC